MSRHIERAQVLIEQSRYELAQKELSLELSADPHNPVAHSLLALCLCEQKKIREAVREAEAAIGLAPDAAFTHYILARVLFDEEKYDKAEKAVREAIRIDAWDAASFGLLSNIYLAQQEWKQALESAEKGLEIDPENVVCTNLRAMALVKLGRKKEAGVTIDSALAREPENDFTHANQGWTLVEQGQYDKAMEHFREALRINPQLDWAREGIIEALKAKNIIYRMILRYFLWMAKFKPGMQWGIIIGFFVVNRVIGTIARDNPALAPYLYPFIALYVVFALLTWIARPLFNLLLRVNRFGRQALSEEQIAGSNLIGGSLLAGFVGLCLWPMLGRTEFLWFAFGCVAMSVPLAGIYSCRPGNGRRFLVIYSVILAALLLAYLGLKLTGSEVASITGSFFVLGWALYTWIGNAVIMKS